MNMICYTSKSMKHKVEISKHLIIKMLDFCKNAIPNETGGILIGCYSDALDKAFVTEITGPSEDSFCSKNIFVRGSFGLQKYLNKLWVKREYYIGEWHFHPYSVSKPSYIDDSQMFNFSKNLSVKCPEPVLIIIGGNPNTDWDISVSIYFNSNIKVELEEIQFNYLERK